MANRLDQAQHDRHHHRPRRHPGLAGRPHQDPHEREPDEHLCGPDQCARRHPPQRGRPERNAMLTAQAQVETERPGRYLVQLCRHASQMGQHLHQRPHTHDGGDAPPEVQDVEWSNTYGIVRLSWGQWTMQTTPDTLTLRAEATDEENLRRIQDLVATRLELFGRREHLKVNWQRLEAPTAQRGEGEHSRGATTSTPRWVKAFPVILVKLGFIALVLVV